WRLSFFGKGAPVVGDRKWLRSFVSCSGQFTGKEWNFVSTEAGMMISHSNKEENRSQRPEESSGILRKMARSVRRLVRSCATSLLPELRELGEPLDWKQLKIVLVDSTVRPTARVYCPSLIVRSRVGDYTYITRGAVIYSTSI